MMARKQFRTPVANAVDLVPDSNVDLAKAWPADHVERRSVASLIPYARNARTHSDAQIAQLAGSIREWGWTIPVLVDEVGGIIAGHGRVLAARMLGIEDVPVMTATGWSETKRRAYVIADNKLASNAGWDAEMLAFEVSDLAAMAFDMTLVGFSAEELVELAADKKVGLSDPDDVPELPVTPVSALVDVWLLGKNRLVCGDCTDPLVVDRALAGAKPYLMVSDPPYGVGYDPAWRNRAGLGRTKRTGKVENDNRADWREAWALFPGTVAYVWHGALHAAEVAESLEACDFKIRAQIVWAKDRLVLGRGDYHWQHEPCWYAVKGNGRWSGDRKQTTLWQIASRDQDTDTIHGTQKPVTCMRRPMENNSRAGDAVYEPFSGSGTTIIAGEITGRSVHAIEISPAYIDVAVLRWEAFTGQQATLEGDGRTFAELAAERLKEVA
jgi:DNA modification methylase